VSLLPILLTAEAASRHAAVRRAAYRHRMVTRDPLVIALYNLPGEAAAPLAFYYGTDPGAGELIVAPEPRNRTVRFEGIQTFSAALVAYIAPFLETQERRVGRAGAQRALEMALEAPQIVVPNRATRDYLGARLGRSLRYLGLGNTHPVPQETLWAGAHLSWLADYVHMPGQSIFVAATETLSRHFATGQSALEDENLATLLAWIENEPGSGLERIAQAERESPAFGPLADPKLDQKLEPHVQGFGRAVREEDLHAANRHRAQVERLVRAPLAEAYAATHRALAILRGLPEAAGVQERWASDLREWSAYARRCARGLPRFRRRHDALHAARLLETWSRAAEELAVREAYDDPLIMAEYDAAGLCLAGAVVSLNLENFEMKAGNRRATLVPLLLLEVGSQPQLLVGDEVWLTGDGRVRCEIRSIAERRGTWAVTLAVLQSHNKGERLPPAHSQAVFARLSTFGGPPPEGPREIPWTHRIADSDAPEREEVTRATEVESLGESDVAGADTEDELGPDFAPEDAVAAPSSSVPEGDVPGVLV
jgi:hypothetical protein